MRISLVMLRRFTSFTFLTPVISAACAACFFAAAPAARADVKIVSKVTITGLPAAAPASAGKQTVTAYYKGMKIRTEAAGTVTIFDAAAKTLTTLTPAKKTYTVASTANPTPNPMMAMMDVQTTATLKPGGKTKTIAGKPAKNYLWQANVSLGMKKSPKASAQASQMPSGPLVTIQMNGEQWTTEAVKMPASGNSLVVSMMSGPAKSVPGLAPLMAKFAQIKGLPLSATLTQTIKQSAAMMAMGGASAKVPQKISTTTEVVSLQESPLPDSLFVVPTGFQKVTVKTPMMPGAM